jgi:membrane protein DedA with SNARE-associated domain
MPQTLVHFITNYGYWAIFWLVFLQEIGIPNPVSNELVLLFSGSLAFTGLLSFPFIFLTAVFADIFGATVLYTVFYLFGKSIVKNKPRWLPISQETIKKLKKPIEKHRKTGMFVGRLLPFARGYAAVVAGLLNISPTDFFIAVISSALVWSGGFVILGNYFGNYITQVENTTQGIEKILLIAIGLTVIVFIIRYIATKKKNQ